MITRHFQIRTCTLEIDGKLPRPCLYYDLHACLGPCVAGLTTREAYGGGRRRRRALPAGAQRRSSRTASRPGCAAASAEENFEMAAAYRDALRTVRDVSERQVVQSLEGRERRCLRLLRVGAGRGRRRPVVRGGVLQDRRDFFFEKAQELEPAAFLEAFLPQFYDANPFLPVRGPPAGRDRRPGAPRRVPRRAPGSEGRGPRSPARCGGRPAPDGGGQRPGASPGPFPSDRRRRGDGRRAPRPGDRARDPASPDRGVRHLALAGNRQRRVDGGLRGRPAEEVGVPSLQHRRAAASRARRLPEHGGGRRAPLPPRPGRERAAARPRPRRRRPGAAPGRADRSRPGRRRAAGRPASPSGRRRSGCRTGRTRSGFRARTPPCS